MEVLNSFQGKWVYKPGKGNIADALTRLPTYYNFTNVKLVNPTVQVRSADDTLRRVLLTILPSANELHKIKEAYALDPTFQPTSYVLKNGIYYTNGGKIVVPDVPHVKEYIMSQCHDSLFAGHMGRDKTVHTVQQLFTWKGLSEDVTDYIKKCPICQTCKPSTQSNHGQLTLPEQSLTPWHQVSVDFITGIPTTSTGHNAILTVVDRCTKMVHLIPTDEHVNAAEFIQLMQDHVHCKHGLSLDMIHDRDPRFT